MPLNTFIQNGRRFHHLAPRSGHQRGNNVEPLHPTETSHAWRVFCFHRTHGFHLVRSFRVNDGRAKRARCSFCHERHPSHSADGSGGAFQAERFRQSGSGRAVQAERFPRAGRRAGRAGSASGVPSRPVYLAIRRAGGSAGRRRWLPR